jgi:LysM repeat protein
MRRPCPWLSLLASLGAVALLTSGCDWLAKPAGNPRLDSHYQDALRWLDQGRWDSARESFYHSLEANPQNLYAHLALGDLYRSRLTNQVLAVYHYSRYLEVGKLQNRDFHDQSAVDGIRNAQVELARTSSEHLFRDQQQYELENLRRTNSLLHERIQVLNHHVAILTQRLMASTNAAFVSPPVPVPGPIQNPVPPVPAATNRVVIPSPPEPAGTRRSDPGPTTGPRRAPEPVTRPAPTLRTHRIQAGENLSTIARRYGLKPADLQAANPGMNPRALRPGQSIIIPTR